MADASHHKSAGSQDTRPIRLGRNVNGYFGERVDIHALLREIEGNARQRKWSIETFFQAETFKLLALRRAVGAVGKRIYISAGIHGDEPAGPLAIRQLLEDDQWPEGMEITVCPCLNPLGFVLNRRENSEGLDLNRQYLQPKAQEIVAHVDWLKRQPDYDFALCLHEDWEAHGFYLYELNPGNQPSFAPAILARVELVCPIDLSEVIEGRPAERGIIRPSLDLALRPQWAEAFFLHRYKTRLTYTLEAPSDFQLGTRVAALRVGVQGALVAASAA
jgi:hypothetical protein